MARIKEITFESVRREEGCLCEKCGQYIKNIWTIHYTDGLRLNLGIDCFDNLNKASGLSGYRMKLFKKALKQIERHKKMYEAEKALTEETDLAYQKTQIHVEWEHDDYWMGHPWSEYHEWRINEFWSYRFKEDQEEIAKFKNVNFAR